MKGRHGFTLVELMIVIGILGILGVLAIPAYQSYVRNAKIGEAKAALETIRLLEEQYYADKRYYLAKSSFTGLIYDPVTNPSGLPGFEPGTSVGKNFLFKVEAIGAITNSFRATATPKSASLGTSLWITHQNQKNW